MIRGAMRIQKTQVPVAMRTTRFTAAGSFVFDKTKFTQAGFKNYEVLVVGAVGGRSSFATGISGGSRFPSGGGGGASKQRSGLLADLGPTTAVVVGAYGLSDGNENANGLRGGSSSFGVLTAPGGYGAQGNAGGRGSLPDGNPGALGGTSKVASAAAITPQTGAWNTTTKEGSGGGGGGGAWYIYPAAPPAGQYSGSGSISPDQLHTAPGKAPAYYPPLLQAGPAAGGQGAGVNAAPVTGVVEYFGDNNGAVIIVVS